MQHLSYALSMRLQLEEWFNEACKRNFGSVMIATNGNALPESDRSIYPFCMIHIPSMFTPCEYLKGRRLIHEPLAILDCTDLIMHPLCNQYSWREFCEKYLQQTVLV